MDEHALKMKYLGKQKKKEALAAEVAAATGMGVDKVRISKHEFLLKCEGLKCDDLLMRNDDVLMKNEK